MHCVCRYNKKGQEKYTNDKTCTWTALIKHRSPILWLTNETKTPKNTKVKNMPSSLHTKVFFHHVSNVAFLSILPFF